MNDIYKNLTTDDFNAEIWAPIVGYKNYVISNIGRIKSLNYNRSGKEQLLKQAKDAYGYPIILLYNSGKSKTLTVHRLVAQTFIDNPESKPQVNHKNGIKTDNRVINLEWVTAKENQNHAWENGLNENLRNSTTGENHGRHKLTDDDCDNIRMKYSKGNVSQRKLAAEYGCTSAHISRIINFINRKTPTPEK